MHLEAHQEKILGQLIRQERLLSRLYGVLAESFPSWGPLWQDLSREESRHAQLLEKLMEAARKGVVIFDEGSVKTYTLTTFIQRLESIVAKAERKEFTLPSAFAHAIDYESALIERNVFLRFDSIHEKAKTSLRVLQSETRQHIDRIRRAQKEAKDAQAGKP